VTEPTNVLLLAIDTLRADHLSCYGYPRLTSPHLDRLAAGGTLFRECVSPHIPTHPGFTTTMTGRDVFAHGIVSHAGARELDPAVPVLAELASARGVAVDERRIARAVAAGRGPELRRRLETL
jgi:arylsulfatase A-like enzyme